MKPMTYLNGILTVLAVLLTLNLWTQWNTGVADQTLPSMTAQAHAAVPAPASGSVQRQKIIEELRSIKTDTNKLNQLLASGKLRVLVEMPGKE